MVIGINHVKLNCGIYQVLLVMLKVFRLQWEILVC